MHILKTMPQPKDGFDEFLGIFYSTLKIQLGSVLSNQYNIDSNIMYSVTKFVVKTKPRNTMLTQVYTQLCIHNK